MSATEIKFTEGLLAALRDKNFTEFPFANDYFNKCVEHMSVWLQEKYPTEYDELDLDLLFWRAPISGTFDNFISVLDYLNGTRLSFSNPRLDRAFLKMSQGAAHNILQRDNKEREIYEGAASRFIDGFKHRAAEYR
ncbi:hypothetical protein LJC15_00720 [Desulfovibrio sp. OttesenSCG-928-G11]|nr:hypothetical protein [Desulfovibrio sp. OttesenSCG-928-G11]